MKYRIAIILLIITNSSISQIPPKDDIHMGYYVGHKAFEAIQNLDKDLIKDYFKDTTNLSFIIERIENKTFHEDSIEITKDVMFNKETKKYEFLIYSGEWIKTEDDWGLYDYNFVIQIDIDLNKEGRENQILNTTIIKNGELKRLELWWKKYMKSYKDPIYMRWEISDAYNLPPPPPPPPETKEWFKTKKKIRKATIKKVASDKFNEMNKK